MLHDARSRHEAEFDLACSEVRCQLGVAAIWHRHGPEAGQEAEIFHGQMAARTRTGMCVAYWLFLRISNKFGHRVDRDGWMHDQHGGRCTHSRDVPEVCIRIERQLLVE